MRVVLNHEKCVGPLSLWVYACNNRRFAATYNEGRLYLTYAPTHGVQLDHDEEGVKGFVGLTKLREAAARLADDYVKKNHTGRDESVGGRCCYCGTMWNTEEERKEEGHCQHFYEQHDE